MPISLRLPPKIETRLENLARRTGRTKSFYIREALLEHLDDLEDFFLAERRLQDVLAGRSDTVPLDELLKRHGLAD
jgi:RHH-type rel operon transcriptional repressor/antitoxin RelB